MEENNKKAEKWTIVGFVLSLLAIVLAYNGVFYGIVLLILEFYCGIQGMRTRYKGFAIATIVLGCISTALLVLSVIVTMML